jgi:MYXO-CTERM domain-containing protein
VACRRTLSEVARSMGGATLGVALSFWSAPAEALTVDLTDPGPSIIGAPHTFSAVVAEASGAVQFQWKFSDADESHTGSADAVWTYPQPGHYFVEVQVTDASGATASDFVQHLVHYPLTPKRPTSSTSIVYDAARNRIYSVNQDNDTITSIDPDQLKKVAELAVYRKPEALALTPEGKLWVVHQDDYAIAVIDPSQFVIERGFRLPYASQPVGLAMSPTGNAAYVSLLALGKLLKLDPTTGAIIAEADVGPAPRGIAVAHDGAEVYVTRFISNDAAGEVVKVNAATMQVSGRILLKLDNETPYSSTEGRGLPNHLFSVGLSPDGGQAWVPSKKDNIVRGLLRDGEKLAPDQIVRPLVSIIDVRTAQEMYERRVDLDDRSPPLHVEFTPYGDLAILALGGTNHVEVRSVYQPADVFTTIQEAGSFPRATVLAPNGRLFVQAWLSREVIAYDMSAALQRYSKSTPTELARISSVGLEKLPAQVLLGKRVFHDSADRRMANEGYVTCGACHFEGTDDGRVYDFSDRGEGLRNTLSLLGRAGTKHGPLNWTGNLDEVQDFEHQIREMFSGKGFMPDEVFHSGTKDQPLGELKAGLSPELDALAAYVASLERVNPSPYRNSDGTLTAVGVAGKGLFLKLGCDFCHSGSEQTDSAEKLLHDVGTVGPKSGSRAGVPLLGLDTPTLLGVWETPPYLHDGSAATLREVLTTSNATGLHGYVAALASEQVDQLVAYLQQIDDDIPTPTLPFEPPRPPPVAGTGGQAGSGGAQPMSGAGGTLSAETPLSGSPTSSCACRLGQPAGRGALVTPALLLASLLGAVARRRRRQISSGREHSGGDCA